MLSHLIISYCIISCVKSLDPKNVTTALVTHLDRHVPRLPQYLFIGNLTFGQVSITDAVVGDFSTLRSVGTTWFWRKYIWFSVFGDLTLGNMFLTGRNITIGGQVKTGRIHIGYNRLNFYWEGLDHLTCTVWKERIDWLPFRHVYIPEGKNDEELNFSEDENVRLRIQLYKENFFTLLRDLLLPCLHPKHFLTYGWEAKYGE